MPLFRWGLLGLAGVALGLPAGIGLGHAILPMIGTTMAVAFTLAAPSAKLSVAPVSLGMASALGIGAAVLAAAVPARRAARIGALASLRGRGTEQPTNSRSRPWILIALTTLAICAVLALQAGTRSASWGLVASALVAGMTALTARPLISLCRSPLVRGTQWLAGVSGRFATAAIVRHPRRSALTTATLGVGLGAVLWLWTLAQSFEQTVLVTIRSAIQADLVLSSSHMASGLIEAPLGPHLLAELGGIPGVAAVAGQRMLEWHYAGGPIALHAADAVYFRDPRFGVQPLSGERLPDVWDAVARGDGVLASGNFMLNLGTRVGQNITLETPSGPLPLRIAGVNPDFLSPRGTVWLSRAVYQRFWNDSQLTHVLVRVDNEADVATVRAEILRRLRAKHSLRILLGREAADHYASQVRRAFAGIEVVNGMVLFVVLFGMADTLAAGVFERTRELGSIRAVGVRRRHVGRMILAEALVVGLLGIVLAVASGVFLGTLWTRTTFPYLLGWTVEQYVPYGRTFVAAVATLTVCVLAGVLPARRAARLDPAVALRYE